MKFIIDGKLEEAEPVVKLWLQKSTISSDIHLFGQRPDKGQWLLGSFGENGVFQPNSEGCKGVGLRIDNTYNK
jgi:hypothetical protein